MNIEETYNWCKGKILSREEAAKHAEDLRSQGKKIVTVNGSFDLLHPGHLVLLTEAKKQGDVLFVGVNTDSSVRQYKNPNRPVVGEAERIAMVAGFGCVDYVVPIADPEAGKAILQAVRPDVHANGSEYGEPETWIEWPTVQEVKAQPYVVQRRANLATTDIIKKIKSLPE